MTTLVHWQKWTIEITKGRAIMDPPAERESGIINRVLQRCKEVPGYSQNPDNDLARWLVKQLPGAEIKELSREFDAEGWAFEMNRLISSKGGPGSGNFEHAGRPGHRGGSQPGHGIGEGGAGYATEEHVFSPNDNVIYTDADGTKTVLSYRGREGDKAVVFNETRGIQGMVPFSSIRPMEEYLVDPRKIINVDSINEWDVMRCVFTADNNDFAYLPKTVSQVNSMENTHTLIMAARVFNYPERYEPELVERAKAILKEAKYEDSDFEEAYERASGDISLTITKGNLTIKFAAESPLEMNINIKTVKKAVEDGRLPTTYFKNVDVQASVPPKKHTPDELRRLGISPEEFAQMRSIKDLYFPDGEFFSFAGVDDNYRSRLKGGAGSGNFGHAGRPGKRGGSSPQNKLGPVIQYHLRGITDYPTPVPARGGRYLHETDYSAEVMDRILNSPDLPDDVNEDETDKKARALTEEAQVRFRNYNQGAGGVKWEELVEKNKPLFEEAEKLAKEYKAAERQRVAKVAELLKVENPVKTVVHISSHGNSEHKPSDEEKEEFNYYLSNVLSCLDADHHYWNTESGQPPKKVTIWTENMGGASWFSSENGRIHMGYANDSGIPSEGSTVIHEFGHWLEHNSPEVGVESAKFLEQRWNYANRQAGYNTVERKGGGAWGYDFVKDNFIDPYMGRIYHDKYGNREGAGTEILSSGLAILFTNPKVLARHDPELFHYVVSALHGLGGGEE